MEEMEVFFVSDCEYQSVRRYCDGDYHTYCLCYDDYCKYKRNLVDCDGKIVSMCRKYQQR